MQLVFDKDGLLVLIATLLLTALLKVWFFYFDQCRLRLLRLNCLSTITLVVLFHNFLISGSLEQHLGYRKTLNLWFGFLRSGLLALRSIVTFWNLAQRRDLPISLYSHELEILILAFNGYLSLALSNRFNILKYSAKTDAPWATKTPIFNFLLIRFLFFLGWQ